MADRPTELDPEALAQQLRAVFHEEATDLLEKLAGLFRSVRAGSDREQARPEAMRLAHTIKGGAATVGFNRIALIAHQIEDMIQGWATVPAGTLPPTLDDCEDAVSSMCALLDDPAAAQDASDMPTAPPARDAGRVVVRGDTPVRPATAAPVPGSAPSPATAAPAPGSTPSPATAAPAPGSTPSPATAAPAPDSAPPRSKPAAPPGEEASQSAASAPRQEHVRSGGVRVEAERLDTAMGYASDLVTVREEIAHLRGTLDDVRERLLALVDESGLAQEPAWRRILDDLNVCLAADQRAHLRLNRTSHELAESMRQLRLVPFDTLTSTWERAVADAARHTGKQARLIVNAADLEIDRHVLETLRDPIIHLLRNAVDHGLEPPEHRLRAGKPGEGTIAIDATVQEGLLLLTVSDDGGGIDVERIRATAVSRGVLSDERAKNATDTDLLELLFATGFTTTTAVTSVSGRGVGLDVVRQAVEAARGHVEVRPKGPLGGAAFHLTLSIDVLWTRVALVRTAGTTYAIPVEAVERTVRVPAKSLERSNGMLVLHLEHDVPLRIESLEALMEHGAVRRSGDLTVVVLSSGKRRLGMIVDDVLGAQEVVVRRLPWNIRRVDRVSGGCLLPDGQVAMVLDPPRLVRASGASVALVEESQKALNRRVLVADDSHTARTLARNALVSAGCEVELAVDGEQAWAALQKGDFGLLVSDIQMPGIDGFELTRRVRADARLARLPVILVTSRSTRDDVERGLSVGADEYIVKGTLQQQQLIEAVARHL